MKLYRQIRMVFTFLLLLISIWLPPELMAQDRDLWKINSEHGTLVVELITDSISVPFGMVFLPNGELLVSDRISGSIFKVDIQTGVKEKISGVPDSFCKGDGGALDLVLHPDFENNNLLYFSHSVGDKNSSTLAIDRAILRKNHLEKIQRIFTAYPHYESPSHYGSRMIFRDEYLYFTMGDRYDLADSAQTLGNHLGKVMRIADDGTVPEDNPFVDTPGARPEIWSYGHRNAQGLVYNQSSDEILLHEHGPKGGDEINTIMPGNNYGWPVISYGTDYDDSPIGQGITHMSGMEQPLFQYTPSIAPSGMEVYSGDRFPYWKDNLFIGALGKRHLNRTIIRNNVFILEERLLVDLNHRVRVVKEGPDGFLYIGVDGGMILRIRPDL